MIVAMLDQRMANRLGNIVTLGQRQLMILRTGLDDLQQILFAECIGAARRGQPVWIEEA